jgi:RNA polymerase sigma factor for flagellar operon FliA
MNPEEQFLSHLELVERIARHTCRRYHCPPDEVEEFASLAKLKLIEDDYAILRKFQGRSRLSTYLASVLQRLFLDHRNHAWGKWRPSAAARRQGPLAETLERLVVRDGQTVDEACETLRTTMGVATSRADLTALAASLPVRLRRRHVDDAALEDLPSGNSRPDHDLLEAERSALAGRVHAELERALEALTAEDRLIMKLRIEQGLQVAEIARILSLPAKPLYRRLEGIYRLLRGRLEASGVDAGAVAEVLAEPAREQSTLARVR